MVTLWYTLLIPNNKRYDMNSAVLNQQAMKAIRQRMLSGQITYAQAKQEAEPLINAINAKSAEIAKKHNMKASKLNFAAIMR